MNQTCKVCGEPAAGFHFGAFTCEGCKSFFGRSYNNLSSISDCKNNGDCIINKKNRTACKACRLRKCLLVGMSKSGSRYGRRSNWFKIHCLLQEQQAAHNNHSLKTSSPTSTPASVLGHSAYPQVLYPSRTKEELLLLGIDDFKHSVVSPSIGSPDSHISDSSLDINVRGNDLSKLGKPTAVPSSVNRDLFLPLSFPGLTTFPAIAPSSFLPPPRLLLSSYHPVLHQQQRGLLKPSVNYYTHIMNDSTLMDNSSRRMPNHNENHLDNFNLKNRSHSNHIPNGAKSTEEITKQFYLDAMLKSQGQSPIRSTNLKFSKPVFTNSLLTFAKENNSDTRIRSKDPGISVSPLISPLVSKEIVSNICQTQEKPIDLSMKTGVSSNSSTISVTTSVDDDRQVSGEDIDNLVCETDEDETTTTTIITAIYKRHSFSTKELKNTNTTEHISDEDVELESSTQRERVDKTSTPLDLTTRM